MGLLEQTLLAFILCLDCIVIMTSISLANVGESRCISKHLSYSILSLSLVQVILAYLGIIVGSAILPWIKDWDHWIIFIFFSYFARKQWHWKPEEGIVKKRITYFIVLALAAMGGIDAFITSLSIGHHFYNVSLFLISLFIFTVVLSLLGPILIKLYGKQHWRRGGRIAAVLIFMLGFKILVEHLTNK